MHCTLDFGPPNFVNILISNQRVYTQWTSVLQFCTYLKTKNYQKHDKTNIHENNESAGLRLKSIMLDFLILLFYFFSYMRLTHVHLCETGSHIFNIVYFSVRLSHT